MRLLALLAFGCASPSDDGGGDGGDGGGGADTGPGERPVPPPSEVDTPARIVAIGDVHGDIAATRAALSLAGLIDENDAWVGGATVLVQTGDELDRGDDERAILELFESLADAAWAAGGAVYALNGNHEVMNVQLDLRYVTDGGFEDFADVAYDGSDPIVVAYPEEQRGRVAAFQPGGPYAGLLAGRNTVMRVGDTVFVHGGVESSYAGFGLDDINGSIQAWMRGEAEDPEEYTSSDDGPVWSRRYSDEADEEDCDDLGDALSILGATRMVVGHTVQDTVNPFCDDRAWRIDVGMSAYYGGTPQALEITGAEIRVLD